MLPRFLLPECIAQADGLGPKIELGSDAGKLLVLTLGINRILEQERLNVSIWGSPDGVDWGATPLGGLSPQVLLRNVLDTAQPGETSGC